MPVQRLPALHPCAAVGSRPACLLCCGAGVGKTLVAKAIAGEAKVPFYQMAGR